MEVLLCLVVFLDHFIISKNIKCLHSEVIENPFDHKLGIFEIQENL